MLTADQDEARNLVRELLTTLADLGTRRWVADAIELAAVILERAGQALPAVRLLGACDAIRSSLGEPVGGLRALAGAVHASHDGLMGMLGDGFSEQKSVGAALSKDEALAYALEWLD